MSENFPSAPASYALRAGEVHIWKIALTSTKAALGNLPSILSAAEAERSSRFSFEKDQARFISCRASLRLLLSRYTGVPADKIAFRYEPQGKPALAGIAGWQFNVSHSSDLAAVAISRYDALGIDIELIDPEFPRGEVAPDIFAPDEVRDVDALPPSSQPGYFFQLWTLKEALLKAAGSGLLMDPRTIHIRLDETLSPAIISAPPGLLGASLHSFTLQSGYSSALSVLAGVSNLGFFTL